jgi:rhamnosyltransferase
MNILVILASYNGEKYINDQIKSILCQEDVKITLLITDDRSTDNTIGIINSINDNRIILNINKKNSGSPAFNFLNTIASLENSFISSFNYISLSDQDDIWLPNKIKEAVSKIYLSKSELYCSNLNLWRSNSTKKTLLKKNYQQKKYDFLFEGGSAGCTYVFSKEVFNLINSYYKNIDFKRWQFFSHDWFIYFLARINDLNVIIDSESYIDYRIHENNVHGQLNLNSIYSIKKRISLIKNGWYFDQINNFQLLTNKSECIYIYNMYKKNIFSRLFILLKYNFSLMRSNKKFLQFFILSLIIKSPYKYENDSN